ncbi:MAG: hypothetical protein L3J29_00470 [Cyclobacteriaceae bacterium]|nr:hypothetical protein [Cyclobacteriaceae bacterium]
MSSLQKTLFVLLVIAFFITGAQAQSKKGAQNSAFSKFLGGFSLHASTGFGATFYNHEINGPGILQKTDGNVYIFNNFYTVGNSIDTGYSGWVNNAQASSNIPVDDQDFLLGTDSVSVKYQGVGGSIPISLTLSYTYDRYRFGGGITYEQSFSAKFYPNVEANNLQAFRPDYVTASIIRYYAYLGGEVYRSKRHTIAVDAMVGTFKLGKKKFNPDQVKTKLFVNIGVSFERSLSEYFKVFIRPSAEFKSYELAVPGVGYTINHAMPALYVNIGAVIRMPNFKKCPVSQCHAQINHRHGRKVYRSKMHPFWKWQDPDYGQNYPELIKYKGKNKKKKNPY